METIAYAPEAQFSTTGDPAAVDRLNALLTIDSSREVQSLAGECFRLQHRFDALIEAIDEHLAELGVPAPQTLDEETLALLEKLRPTDWTELSGNLERLRVAPALGG